VIRTLTLLLFVTVASAGCIAKRTAAWSTPPTSFGDVSEQILSDLVADGDKAWKDRADSKQVDEAARSWGAALRYNPSDHQVLTKLARVAMRRAAVVRGAAGATHLEEAITFAERALSARNPALLSAARGGKKPVDVFSHAESPDAPALALYAEALLGWSVAHGMPTVLKQREWISAAAARALALDPAVGFGAPYRVLGTLDCELPDARENLRDALVRFEAAVAVAPAYLPTRVVYAEEYATRMSDAALYKRLLEEVVAADPNALADAAPENADAQRAARKLLGRK